MSGARKLSEQFCSGEVQAMILQFVVVLLYARRLVYGELFHFNLVPKKRACDSCAYVNMDRAAFQYRTIHLPIDANDTCAKERACKAQSSTIVSTVQIRGRHAVLPTDSFVFVLCFIFVRPRITEIH